MVRKERKGGQPGPTLSKPVYIRESYNSAFRQSTGINKLLWNSFNMHRVHFVFWIAYLNQWSESGHIYTAPTCKYTSPLCSYCQKIFSTEVILSSKYSQVYSYMNSHIYAPSGNQNFGNLLIIGWWSVVIANSFVSVWRASSCTEDNSVPTFWIMSWIKIVSCDFMARTIALCISFSKKSLDHLRFMPDSGKSSHETLIKPCFSLAIPEAIPAFFGIVRHQRRPASNLILWIDSPGLMPNRDTETTTLRLTSAGCFSPAYDTVRIVQIASAESGLKLIRHARMIATLCNWRRNQSKIILQIRLGISCSISLE